VQTGYSQTTPPIPPPIIASVDSFLYLQLEDSAAGIKPDPEQLCKNLGVPWDEQVLSHRHSIFQTVRLPFGTGVGLFADSSALSFAFRTKSQLELYFLPFSLLFI
jgi:hypothetical protein